MWKNSSSRVNLGRLFYPVLVFPKWLGFDQDNFCAIDLAPKLYSQVVYDLKLPIFSHFKNGIHKHHMDYRNLWVKIG